jgi:hypothetical protein
MYKGDRFDIRHTSQIIIFYIGDGLQYTLSHLYRQLPGPPIAHACYGGVEVRSFGVNGWLLL